MMSSVSNLIGAAGFPAAVTKIGLGLKPVLPRGGRPCPSSKDHCTLNLRKMIPSLVKKFKGNVFKNLDPLNVLKRCSPVTNE